MSDKVDICEICKKETPIRLMRYVTVAPKEWKYLCNKCRALLK